MKILLIDAPATSLLDQAPALYVDVLGKALAPENKVVQIRGVPTQAALREIVRAEQPEIVHLHRLANFSLLKVLNAVGTGRFDRVPVVLTLHDYRLRCAAHDLRHTDGRGCRLQPLCRTRLAVNRAICGPVALVVSPSHYLLDRHLEQRFFNRATRLVLPYGRSLSPPAGAGVGEGTRNIVFLGLMQSSDGPQVLIRAFRRLPDPGLRLHLLGGGPELRACAALAEGDPRILFHGAPTQEAWRELLATADCAILPTLWESSPPPRLFEAMASNAVVIASRIGGIPELLKHEVNGLLVEPGDEAGLAQAILRVRQSPELAARLRAEAGETARFHDMAFHTAHLSEAYRRLIADNRVSPFSRKAA